MAERRRIWWGRVQATGILLLAIGLVASVFVPVPHTGGDNAGYLGLAHALLDRAAYLDLYLPGEPIHTKYPPGFPLLLAGARLLGAESWTAFKAVVALSTVATVLLSYLWVKDRRGAGFAAAVAVLLSLASALLYYSHWILSDVPFVALTLLGVWGLDRAGRPFGDGSASVGADRWHGRIGWTLMGCAAALAAYFTRSAGLPLVVAVLAVLALRRRWKEAASFGAVFGVLAALWWLRGRGAPDTYLAEVWLVDPYQPDLGRVGLAGLVTRFFANAWGYVSRHVPGGIAGLDGAGATILGIALASLAAGGWWSAMKEARDRIGVVEIFVPLYAVIIFLWPEVWSGDRFALPLLPFLLFYAGTTLHRLGRKLHPRGGLGLAVAGFLVVAVPSLGGWVESMEQARACRSASDARGTWACAGPAMGEFAAVAAWSSTNLPDGSTVLSRKPRFFHLLSGLKSQTFPLSRERDAFFAEADRWDAQYVLLDRLDGLAAYYVVPVVQDRPGAFCPVAGFESAGPSEASGAGSRLLGIVAGRDESGGDSAPGEPATERSAQFSPCPAGMVREPSRPVPDYSSSSVPLFTRSES